MASKTDTVVTWLVGLGYVGSLADMQYRYLVDLAIAAPVDTSGSFTDLQVRLGLPVATFLTPVP